MLLKITKKIIQENAFEQNEKKPGLFLTLGEALISLWTTGPWAKPKGGMDGQTRGLKRIAIWWFLNTR